MFLGGSAQKFTCIKTLKFTCLTAEVHAFTEKLEQTLPSDSEQGCQHEHLKTIQPLNFQGKPIEYLLAEFLLKNAVSLKKMKVIRLDPMYHGDSEWSILKSLVCKPKIGLEKVRQALEGLCLCAGTKLIVV